MKRFFYVLVIVLLSYFSIKPLLISGFFPMHDDTQVGRVVSMGKALRTGQFPVRWVADLGYGFGYPIFNFYGPLPYYFGGGLYAMGFGALSATKTMMAVGMVTAGLTMLLLSSSVFGLYGGLLSSVLYVYAPYHAVQLYVRGAVGELWAYGFLPLVLYGIIRLCNKKTTRNSILIGSLGLFGVITSHTIFGYMTIGLVLLGFFIALIRRYLIVNDRKIPLVSYSMLGLFGLGASAFFWLPAFTEMHFTNVGALIGPSASYKDHFVCLSQLWYSAWGFGGSAPGCIDGMSYMLGKLHILIPIIFIILWIFQKKRASIFLWILLFTLLSVFFMSEISLPFWNVLPFSAFIQYPWRILTFTLLGLSFLSGGALTLLRFKRYGFYIASIGIFAVVFMNTKWFTPQFVDHRSPKTYETEDELRFRVSKISDEYLPPDVYRPMTKDGYVHDTIKTTPTLNVKTKIDTGTRAVYELISTKLQTVAIQRAYFPGWRYWVNEREITPEISGGLPIISIPEGVSTVSFSFRNTPIRTVANILTLISIGAFIYWYGKNKKTIS